MPEFTPITLVGRTVTLVPLTEQHVEPLAAIGLDESLWTLTPTPLRSADDMRDYVFSILRDEWPAVRQRLLNRLARTAPGVSTP